MIPSSIDLHPAAVKEARTAYRWYLRRSATAAARFQAAFEAALEQIARLPNRWPAYLHGTRYRLLRRFPFIVVYRKQRDRLQVVAVAHGRFRPAYWKRRKFSTDLP
jgi:toxin ParE1/3/4